MSEAPAGEADSGPRKLLSVTRAWPWGLAVVTDPASNEPLPTALDAHGVAAGTTVIAASIQHAIDGEAVTEVWQGHPGGNLTCAYEGDFVTASGAVTVGDAAYEQHAPVEIGEGRHQLQVLMSEVESPSRVVFSFTRRSSSE